MATLTITTTPDQDARISAAFGNYLGVSRNATGLEVKQAVIGWIVAVVQQQERQAAVNALALPAPVTPS